MEARRVRFLPSCPGGFSIARHPSKGKVLVRGHVQRAAEGALDVGTVSVSQCLTVLACPLQFWGNKPRVAADPWLMRITEPLKVLRTLSFGTHCLGLVFYSENGESATEDDRSLVCTNWAQAVGGDAGARPTHRRRCGGRGNISLSWRAAVGKADEGPRSRRWTWAPGAFLFALATDCGGVWPHTDRSSGLL